MRDKHFNQAVLELLGEGVVVDVFYETLTFVVRYPDGWARKTVIDSSPTISNEEEFKFIICHTFLSIRESRDDFIRSQIVLDKFFSNRDG